MEKKISKEKTRIPVEGRIEKREIIEGEWTDSTSTMGIHYNREEVNIVLRFEVDDAFYIIRLNPRLEGTIYKEICKNGEIQSMEEGKIAPKQRITRQDWEGKT